MKPTLNDLLKKDIHPWGLQTVLFAMNIKATDLDTMQDSQDFMTSMSVEAKEVAEILWNEAVSQCGKPIAPGTLTLLFARKVFNWCDEHRNSS